MKSEIKKGDEVRLKTGGPVMKVKNILDGHAECEWVVVDKQVNMRFKLSSLLPEPENKLK